MTKPEILVLSWIPPSFKNGGGIRIHYLLRELGKSFRITFACPDAGGRTAAQFPDIPLRVVSLSGALAVNSTSSMIGKLVSCDPPFAARYRLRDGALQIEELLECHSFSGIQVFQVHMMLNLPEKAFSLPVHVDLFDILASISKRDMAHGPAFAMALNGLRFLKTAAWEKRVLRTASFISVVSGIDREVVRHWHPDIACVLAPNGADVDRFHPPPLPGAPGRKANSMIFVGSMGYRPNHDAILFFMERVLPLVRKRHPDACLTIAGSSVPSDLRRVAERLHVDVVDSPEDIRPYLHAALVSVVPIFNGGGTRIKILEAAAAGVAVVATPVGAEGLRMRDGEHLLVREMPEPFAEGICHLFSNPDAREQLVKQAQRMVQDEYDWSVVSRPLLTAWRQSLGVEIPA